MRIHPSSVIDRSADLAADVEVGPFVVIGPGVRVGSGSRILANAFLTGACDVGARCEIHPGAVIGQPPQIRGFAGACGGVIIGDDSVIREQVTIHAASRPAARTVVGRGALLMAGSHVAHDCQLGEQVTLANAALLAGHVTLGDHAFISGHVVIHQFARIGALALVEGGARVGKDVPPYMVASGRSSIRGVNIVGMRRAGVPHDERRAIRRAYMELYRSGQNVSQAVARLRSLPPSRALDALIAFIDTSTRGICRGPRARRTIEAAPSYEWQP